MNFFGLQLFGKSNKNNRNKNSKNYKRAKDKSKAEKHRRNVYNNTVKPEHYVHVDEPKTLQDERQIQFNKWCRRNGVYCGSYLPANPDTLTQKGKGWTEITAKNKKTDNTDREFLRKSTKQKAYWEYGDYNKNGIWADEHYHWRNPSYNKKKPKEFPQNLDRYGRPTDDEHYTHLAPLDRDYNFNNKKIRRDPNNDRKRN